MKHNIKLKGQLRIYLQWPLYLSILLIVSNAVVGMISRKAGLALAGFTWIYLLTALWFFFVKRKRLYGTLVEFASGYAQMQRRLFEDTPYPCALADTDGRILWANQQFSRVMELDKIGKRNLSGLMPDISRNDLEFNEETKSLHITYGDCQYRMDLKKINLSTDSPQEQMMLGSDGTRHDLLYVYLYDETRMLQYEKAINEQKTVMGLIYLDNYDEALESVEEVRRSLLMALIDRKISKYISAMNGVAKKIEKDKYFFIIKQQYVDSLRECRFSILEDVKTVNIGNDMAVTLSIGLGMGGETYVQNYDYARAAIDMALGRGGDQAVIKDGETTQYYGGKSQQKEKTTRVKARVKAHALRELMETKDRILIMGHKLSDIDSFGAAIGIYRISTSMNKKAHVVINEVTSSVRPMQDRFKDSPDYPEDLFLTETQALDLVDGNTMLVVVDVNRPSITDAPSLLKRVKTVVVLDHHRQSSEIIDNAVLSYVEPYASSACEMVAEILQYIAGGIKIRALEADAMYAGIIIDTQNFMSQTGVRTFEAAAFLRRNGADIARVRKMFRDEMGEMRAKAEAVTHAEIYKGAFAISVCPADGLDSPTIVGAQAANTLLDVVGIKASVVLSNYNNKIYISARSIDEVNVQVMMEQLGGGGHRTTAGAQMTGVTVEEAIDRLKEVIDQMLEKGDIS